MAACKDADNASVENLTHDFPSICPLSVNLHTPVHDQAILEYFSVAKVRYSERKHPASNEQY